MIDGSSTISEFQGKNLECDRAGISPEASLPLADIRSSPAVCPSKSISQGDTRHSRRSSGKADGNFRILLVDDHPVVRKGIATTLLTCPHFNVVGEAGDGLEALRQVRELAPDLVVMDLDLPLMNGFAATECICRKFHGVKVLILSMHNSSEYAMRAIRSGARGFISKTSSCEELVNAIKILIGGGTYFSGEVVWRTVQNFRPNPVEQETSDLSERQIEVLICIVAGKENREIADFLNISVRTVESHRAQLMRRLSAHTIPELTRYAVAKGLVSLDYPFSIPTIPEISTTTANSAADFHAESIPA